MNFGFMENSPGSESHFFSSRLVCTGRYLASSLRSMFGTCIRLIPVVYTRAGITAGETCLTITGAGCSPDRVHIIRGNCTHFSLCTLYTDPGKDHLFFSVATLPPPWREPGARV